MRTPAEIDADIATILDAERAGKLSNVVALQTVRGLVQEREQVSAGRSVPPTDSASAESIGAPPAAPLTIAVEHPGAEGERLGRGGKPAEAGPAVRAPAQRRSRILGFFLCTAFAIAGAVAGGIGAGGLELARSLAGLPADPYVDRFIELCGFYSCMVLGGAMGLAAWRGGALRPTRRTWAAAAVIGTVMGCGGAATVASNEARTRARTVSPWAATTGVASPTPGDGLTPPVKVAKPKLSDLIRATPDEGPEPTADDLREKLRRMRAEAPPPEPEEAPPATKTPVASTPGPATASKAPAKMSGEFDLDAALAEVEGVGKPPPKARPREWPDALSAKISEDREVRSCIFYSEAATGGATPTATAQVTVDTSGAVSTVKVTAENGDSNLGHCLSNAIKGLDFGPASGSPVTFTWKQ